MLVAERWHLAERSPLFREEFSAATTRQCTKWYSMPSGDAKIRQAWFRFIWCVLFTSVICSSTADALLHGVVQKRPLLNLLTHVYCRRKVDTCVKMFSSLCTARLLFWISPRIYSLYKFRETVGLREHYVQLLHTVPSEFSQC